MNLLQHTYADRMSVLRAWRIRGLWHSAIGALLLTNSLAHCCPRTVTRTNLHTLAVSNSPRAPPPHHTMLSSHDYVLVMQGDKHDRRARAADGGGVREPGSTSRKGIHVPKLPLHSLDSV